MTERIGYICGPAVYEWGGWTFEFSPGNGPWPMSKDGEPQRRPTKAFWRMWEQFAALRQEERGAARVVDGGCTPIHEEAR